MRVFRRPPVRRRRLAGTAAVAAVTCLATVSPTAFAVTTGSSSGGDPYFPLDGNGGYQVEHYRIVDTYRPGTDQLTGKTVLRLVAGTDLSTFHLDLALTADRVLVDGKPAAFDKPDPHELRVTPAAPVRAGRTVRVVVAYHGRPATTRAVGQRPFSHVAGEGSAVGQPQIGPWWFAANETPTDKATYDIVLRVPRGQEAVSNGELVGQRRQGDWTRWSWRMSEPMTTYLAFFVAGRLDLERSTVDGRPVVYAVSQALSAAAQREAWTLLRRTTDVVAWLAAEVGRYPFTSTGGVVTGTPLGYALENQSRPVYPYYAGMATDTAIVVHEQAHQWFGDSVGVTRWRDIWLTEGFATYAEWLYAETHGGRSVATRLRDRYDGEATPSPFWRLRISDPGAGAMFDEPVYVRGAMTLAALRTRIGPRALTEVLRTWVVRHAGGHGTDAQFRALAEEVSGLDLDGFFGHWLDDPRKPDDTVENGLR